MAFYYFLTFLIFVLFVAHPIGVFLLQKLSFKEDSLVSKILLSVTLGLWLITVEGFILGEIGLWKLAPVFIIAQSLLSIIYLKRKLFEGRFKFDFFVSFLIIVVVGINALITVPFGVINGNNLRLGGVHATDSNWHLSLINSIEKSVPPENPLFSGTVLSNYHYLTDLQMALVGTITHIPVDILFYQIIGPFYILLYASLAYLVGKELTKFKIGGIISVVLTSLSSNWYYIANYFYPSSYRWPSVAWVDYFSSKSVNYPLLFSVIILFLLIYMLLKIKKFDFEKIFVVGLLMGSLMSIKSHTAIVLLASLGMMGVVYLIKREFHLLIISFVGGVFASIFLFLTFAPSKQILILSPFWFIKTMFEAPDRLNFDIWELKRQYLLSVGAYAGIAKLYLEGLFIFIGVNLNFLIFGLFVLKKQLDLSRTVIAQLLSLVTFFSIALTMLFIYRGDAIVTIQFFYTAIVAMSLLCSILFVDLYRRRRLLGIAIFFVLWLSLLPGVFYTIKAYSLESSGTVSDKVVEGIVYLRGQADGVVLVDIPFTQNSLVSAYSDKTLYYADKTVLSSLSIDGSQRRKNVEDFFTCKDTDEMTKLMRDNNIKYIFSTSNTICLQNVKFLQKVYSNNAISIYK